MIYFRLLHAGSMSDKYLVLYPRDASEGEYVYIVELSTDLAMELYCDDVVVEFDTSNDQELTIRHYGEQYEGIRFWICEDDLGSIMKKCTRLIEGKQAC